MKKLIILFSLIINITSLFPQQDTNYQLAIDFFKRKYYEDAIEYLNKYIIQNPEDKKASELLEEIYRYYRTFQIEYLKGRDLFNRKLYKSALAQFDVALKFGNSLKMQYFIAEAKKKLFEIENKFLNYNFSIDKNIITIYWEESEFFQGNLYICPDDNIQLLNMINYFNKNYFFIPRYIISNFIQNSILNLTFFTNKIFITNNFNFDNFLVIIQPEDIENNYTQPILFFISKQPEIKYIDIKNIKISIITQTQVSLLEFKTNNTKTNIINNNYSNNLKSLFYLFLLLLIILLIIIIFIIIKLRKRNIYLIIMILFPLVFLYPVVITHEILNKYFNKTGVEIIKKNLKTSKFVPTSYENIDKYYIFDNSVLIENDYVETTNFVFNCVNYLRDYVENFYERYDYKSFIYYGYFIFYMTKDYNYFSKILNRISIANQIKIGQQLFQEAKSLEDKKLYFASFISYSASIFLIRDIKQETFEYLDFLSSKLKEDLIRYEYYYLIKRINKIIYNNDYNFIQKFIYVLNEIESYQEYFNLNEYLKNYKQYIISKLNEFINQFENFYLYTILGYEAYRNNEYEESIDYYKKAIDYTKNKNQIKIIQQNITNIYFNICIDKAINFYEKGIFLEESLFWFKKSLEYNPNKYNLNIILSNIEVLSNQRNLLLKKLSS